MMAGSSLVGYPENSPIKQAVILAGGRGSRLRPLTDSLPKPLAPVNQSPFLDYLIHSLLLAGITDVLILAGYKGRLIDERYESLRGINVQTVLGGEHDSTGERVDRAQRLIRDRFLLVYGDNFWPLDLKAMWENYSRLSLPVTATIFLNKDGSGEYGFENNVFVDSNDLILQYDRTRKDPVLNGLNIGYFLIDKHAIGHAPAEQRSLEDWLLLPLIREKNLGAFLTNKRYYWITDLPALKKFESEALRNNFLPLPK